MHYFILLTHLQVIANFVHFFPSELLSDIAYMMSVFSILGHLGLVVGMARSSRTYTSLFDLSGV